MQPYDLALINILNRGDVQKNRTGVPARSVFGLQVRYQIDECFPLLTRRKVWPKAIWAELLWFINGSANNKDLQALGSNIWTPWVDSEFEAKHNYVEGALGPVYGFQLRHFNGDYARGDTQDPNYGKGGHDQLADMVNILKTDPDSRRNLFSLWNPQQLAGMRLPPCHYAFEVSVRHGKLSGCLTQRSCDYPVGVPANIQFYSTLIHMLAQQCGYTPYEFVHNTIDAHIYENQVDAVKEYLMRPKMESPRLNLKSAPSIYEYTMDHFELLDYDPMPAIKIPVVV
jgi:thymidylate synthase